MVQVGLIKFTILVWVVYYVYIYFLKNYLRNNPIELCKYAMNSYIPVYKFIVAILNISRFILLIISIIKLLFFS